MLHRDTGSFAADSSGEEGTGLRSRTTSAVGSTTPAESSTSEGILPASTDPDCRMCFGVCAEQSRSASNTIRFQYIKYSLSYKVVNRLVNREMIHERIRIRAANRSEREPIPGIRSVYALFTTPNQPEPSFTTSQSTDSVRHRRAITDGGEREPDASEESDPEYLGDIFVEITGEEELVDEQEIDRPARHLSRDGEDNAISEYVSTVTKDDGLTGSLPDGQPQE